MHIRSKNGSTFKSTRNKLSDYTQQLSYECDKISIDAQKEYWEARGKLVDYYNDQEHYLNLIKQAGFNELYYFIKRKEYKFII